MRLNEHFPKRPDSVPKTVVLFVSADPKPRDDIALAQTKRSIVFPDANHADTATALLEVQRRMMWVALPESVLIARQLLHRRRQLFETFPKAPICLAGHGRPSSLPSRMFLRTSSRIGRSRPSSAKSASIWRSQAAFSRSRINEASSANSRGESVSTAFLISVRLTLQN